MSIIRHCYYCYENAVIICTCINSLLCEQDLEEHLADVPIATHKFEPFENEINPDDICTLQKISNTLKTYTHRFELWNSYEGPQLIIELPIEEEKTPIETIQKTVEEIYLKQEELNLMISTKKLPQSNQGENFNALNKRGSESFSKSVKRLYLDTLFNEEELFLHGKITGVSEFTTLEGHTKANFTIAFSTSGNYIASASRDRTFKVWDFWTGECMFSSRNHSLEVFDVNFSVCGQFLASAGMDRTVRIWKVENWNEIKTLEHEHFVFSIEFSPCSKFLAASSKNSIYLWDTTTWETIKKIEDISSLIFKVSFSPCRLSFVVASNEKYLNIFETESGVVKKRLEGHSNKVYSAVFSPCGKFIASVSKDNSIRIWDLEIESACFVILDYEFPMSHLSFSPCGRYLSFAERGMVVIWDVKLERECFRWIVREKNIFCVPFSRCGMYLAFSSEEDPRISVYNLHRGRI